MLIGFDFSFCRLVLEEQDRVQHAPPSYVDPPSIHPRHILEAVLHSDTLSPRVEEAGT